MSTFKEHLLAGAYNTAGTLLTSPLPHQFWRDCVYFVDALMNDENLTSVEKHAKVNDQLHQIFAHDLGPVLKLFGQTFVDIAIKCAYLYILAQNPAASAIAQAAVDNIKT